MSSVSALGNRTLDQLKVPELKEELRKRGILPKGLKKELIERLEQALREEGQVGDFRDLYIQGDGGEDGQDISEPQKFSESELAKENECLIVDNEDTEKHIEPEINDVYPESVVIGDKSEILVSPPVETLSEAQQIKTVHLKEESMEAITPKEERKCPVEAPLPVTTGFEIASSADMETDVIVQSVPGFSHDSDLLPGTLCEAGSQSHPALPASEVSMDEHQREHSVGMQEQNHNVDQSDLSLMQSDTPYESKSEQGLPLESTVPPEQADKYSALCASSIHPEPEIPCQITDDAPLVVKASSEVELNQMEESLSKISSFDLPDSSLPEVKPLVESFQEKCVHPSEPVKIAEAVLSTELSAEDGSLEIVIPDQLFLQEKSIAQTSETSIVTSDSFTKMVSGRVESVPCELSVEANKARKDSTLTGRDDRRIEPRGRFEEKARVREGVDVGREQRDLKRSDREVPRDRREHSRSRLSQEGLAKVKEEVEKATTKDRIRVESGSRRTEPRVQKEPVEEKLDARVVKDEPGLKDDPRGIDDELKVRDVKAMDIDLETHVGSKRKEAGEDSQYTEPLKRQRRWNSGKNLETHADIKPSPKPTNDKAKDVVTSVKTETRNSSFVGASMPQPASSIAPTKVPFSGNSDQHFVSRQTQYAVKNDDSSNGEPMKKRIVPPPTRNPTTSLRIDRFLRPFTLNAVKELLSQTGTFHDFWMDHIKSHCYVTYSSVDEAIATRNELYNLQWPPVGGKTLTAEFVDPEEVKLKSQSTNEKPAATGVAVPYTAPAMSEQVSAPFAGRVQANAPAPNFALPPPPPRREKPISPPKREPEPAIPTLDDLFKKTRAKPHIYYLPLTEEQVAAKLVRSKQSLNKLPTRA